MRQLSINDIEKEIAKKFNKKKDIKMVVSREQVGVERVTYEDGFQQPPPYGEAVGQSEHNMQPSSFSLSSAYSSDSITRAPPDKLANTWHHPSGIMLFFLFL